jgi:hypothetical protein
MRLHGIGKAGLNAGGPASGGTQPASADGPRPGRALVPVTPAGPSHKAPEHFRQAPFLAQLIASKDQHPQLRERRRAEPQEAIAAYRVGAALAKHW